MDDSATELIYIGAYLLIFMSAVALTIYLFRAVYDYSESAYKYQTVAINDSDIVMPAEDAYYRYVSASELVSYFSNYIKKDNYAPTDNFSDCTVTIKNSAGAVIFATSVNNDRTYSEFINTIQTNHRYILKYIGNNN